MPTRPRLRKGDISLDEVYQLSLISYRKSTVDNKLKRMRLDCRSAKITFRNNLSYDRQNKKWEQTGREVKIVAQVRTKPISYPKRDSIPVHVYPVTFLIRDVEMGVKSAFRFRSGGLKKWRTSRQKISEGKDEREKDKIRNENKRIEEWNIRNGLDGSFIFTLMFVLNMYDLLFGPVTCRRSKPIHTNKQMIPFFDKHSLYVYTRIVKPLLEKGVLNQKSVKNPAFEK